MNARREHLLGDIVAAVLATASFGSSLRHVQTVAAGHGQRGLISWAIAISVELVALVAILELRRARGQDRVPVAAVVALAAGLIMSAGANLATATGSGFGWSQVVAVWPAVAYVLVAVIIETRPEAAADDAAAEDDTTEATTESPQAAGPVDDVAPQPARLHSVPAVPAPSSPRRANIPAELLDAVLDGELTQAAAAERAGVSVRTLQRRIDAKREERKEQST